MIRSSSPFLFLSLSLALVTACSDDPEPATDTGGGQDTGTDSDAGGNDVETGNDADRDTSGCVDDSLSPNQSATESSPLEIGSALTDLVICPGTSDWFSISLSQGDLVAVEILFAHDDGDLDLLVYAPDAISDGPITGSESLSDDEIAGFEAMATGTYSIQVLGFEDAENAYALNMLPGCLADSDCGGGLRCDRRDNVCSELAEPDCGVDATDPNNSDSVAVDVTFSGGSASLQDYATCVGDLDFFAVTLAEVSSITALVTTNNNATTLGVFLLDSEGLFIAQAQTGEDVTDPEATVVADHVPAGDYYIVTVLFVEDETSRTADGYTLDITATPGLCANFEDCENGAYGLFCQGEGDCHSIDGQGSVAIGDACDSDDDCVDGADLCSIDTQSAAGFLCTTTCADAGDDCSGVGEGAFCNEGLGACQLPCDGSNGLCTDGDYCNRADQCVAATCQDTADCDRDGYSCVYNNAAFSGDCGTYEVPTCGVSDSSEPNNLSSDAATFTLAEGTGTLEGLSLCVTDVDIFAVTAAAPGRIDVSVTTDDDADLDVYIHAIGQDRALGVGVGTETTGEEAVGRYVDAGEYLVRVVLFEADSDEVNYDLEISYTAEACSAVAHCEDTSPLRLSCDEDGACLDFDGDASVALGGDCDDNGDCTDDADLCFIGRTDANEDLQHHCTTICFASEECTREGTDCAALDEFVGACVF